MEIELDRILKLDLCNGDDHNPNSDNDGAIGNNCLRGADLQFYDAKCCQINQSINQSSLSSKYTPSSSLSNPIEGGS